MLRRTVLPLALLAALLVGLVGLPSPLGPTQADAAQPTSGQSTYVPLEPVRLLDTRTGGVRLGAGGTLDLPVVDGLTAAATLQDAAPATRTLILTSLGRPGTLRRALAAKVGGYILKDAPPGELADAIRAVARGERVVDSQLALAAWDDGDCPLTSRELDVLRLAAGGDDVPEIAAALHLSQGTVRNYLTAAGTKLQARNRLDTVRIANEAGWL